MKSTDSRRHAGITLTELLVSMGILTFLMLILSSATESAGRAWRDGQARTDTYQSARSALELMARELSSAVVDTRMQFVIGPSTMISNVVRKTSPELADKFSEGAPIALWMAPLGEDGSLRCVGYYVHRDPVKRFYRLKRLLIGPPTSERDSPFFPRMLNLRNAKDVTLRTSPINAQWFTRSWTSQAFDDEDPLNEDVVVSAAADGVIALWLQPVDLLGNPVPSLASASNHPKSSLYYNSAAYFQAATTTPFEDGTSFRYLAETRQSMKGNRLPAFMDIAVITLDGKEIARGDNIPEQLNVFDKSGTLDLEASRREYERNLQDAGIRTARAFTTRARLINGN
ncbi:MAG TPA: prepilin-type N-terminal cleavage/methylation domain-containing protein [Chthoniobacteraceae bacterium]|nr:prepilin-type N-terminal cleavage/methylation domain-containing protein [Chthoniobacteraceae bacterium]